MDTRSVVVTATAACSASSAVDPSPLTRAGSDLTSGSILILRPITPVDSSSSGSFSAEPPRAFFSSAALSSQSAYPRSPVAAFAWPALISTARAVGDRSSARRQKVTGAAHMTFFVKTPAAAAGGREGSTATSARSALGPDARKPPAMPLARNPFAAQTPPPSPSRMVQGPGGIRIGAAGMSKAEVGGAAAAATEA